MDGDILKTTCLKLAQAACSMARQQNFQQFVKQARHRFVPQQCRMGCQRRGSGFIQHQTQLARQTDGAQNPHRVFHITFRRIANHHQPFGADIRQPVVKINNLLILHIIIQRIASEIAPKRILRQRAIRIIAHNPAALVVLHIAAAAKRADFNRFRTHHHMHNLKTPPDNPAAFEHAAHLFRQGVGGHVKIFRRFAQQQIAYCTANQIRLKTGTVQAGQHFQHGMVANIQCHWMPSSLHFVATLFMFRTAPRLQPFFQHNLSSMMCRLLLPAANDTVIKSKSCNAA